MAAASTRSHRETRITRLGEGVDARRRLLPVPIARVRNVPRRLPAHAESLGAERALAVATSAVRDAENGEAFLGEIEWSYGFATRLLARRRGGVAHAPRRRRRSPGTLRRRHRRRLDRADRRRLPRRASSSARCGTRSASSRRPAARSSTHCAARCGRCSPSAPPSPRARSASPERSRRSPRSTSASSEYDRARVHGHRLARAGARAQLARLAALTVAERRARAGDGAGARARDRRRRRHPRRDPRPLRARRDRA